MLRAGSDLVGQNTGAVIGAILAGPGGAAVGATAGWAMTRIAGVVIDMAQRDLSRRETARVGAVAVLAATRIQASLDKGRQARNDGFFQDSPTGRPPADEILEGTLLKAKAEHEERKLPFLANLLANIAFDDTLTAEAANHLLMMYERLTYRKLCILALLHLRDIAPDNCPLLYDGDYGIGRALLVGPDATAALQETYELYHLGLAVCATGQPDWSGDPSKCHSLLEWINITPNLLRLTVLGRHYSRVLGVADIPNEDVQRIAMLFAPLPNADN